VFSVVRKSPIPLGDQLVERVAGLIESGRLPEGSRLPSVRQLARRVGVSVYTVTSAFERLSAKGLIDARAGAGYFVAPNRSRTPLSQVELGPLISADPILGFTRQAIEQANFSVPAGSGFLPAAWLSGAVPSSILSKVARSGVLLESAAVQGDAGLRELLAERIRMAGFPVAAARLHRPRMFVTQTVLHNPTGTSASAANCHGILTLAEKYNFIVAEDHVYTDLAPRRVVSLAQIDELKRVLYVGSFTKVLGPGMRIGFIAAPEALVSQLVDSKILGVLSGSALDEFVLREMLASGKYRKHIERLRDRLGTTRAAATAALRRAGLTIEQSAADGIFLWCRLPAGVDPERLSVDARTEGILLAKGAMFSISGRGSDYLRINAAYGSEPALTQFLASHCEAAA
jgi:DNA-binding transcriptional MocR family regulator